MKAVRGFVTRKPCTLWSPPPRTSTRPSSKPASRFRTVASRYCGSRNSRTGWASVIAPPELDLEGAAVAGLVPTPRR